MYGILTQTDVATVERSLDSVIAEFKDNLKLLELGLFDGHTAQSVANYLTDKTISFEYYGIDSGKECGSAPFPACKMIWGSSDEVFMQAPDNINWLMIDGCNCNNHVMLDFLNLQEKVCEGGYVLFHNANPKNQFKFDYQGHGPKDKHEFGSAVPTALRKLGLSTHKRLDWELVETAWDDQNWGGFAVYRKRKLNCIKSTNELTQLTAKRNNNGN